MSDVELKLEQIRKNPEELKAKLGASYSGLRKFRVALDLDGVLADLHSVVLPELSARLGKPVYVSDIDNWLAIVKKFGVKEEDGWDWYGNAWVNHTTDQVQPTQRNLSDVTRKMNYMALVDIVSAHNEASREAIIAWLKLHHIVYNSLVLTDKNRKTEVTDYDIYIDDYYKTLRRVGEAGKLAICYNQPWNMKEDVNGAIRINNLEEVLEILQRGEGMEV